MGYIKKSKVFSIGMVLFSLGFAHQAFAIRAVQDRFIKAYGLQSDSKLNSCGTCHQPVERDALNNYGLHLKEKFAHNFNDDAFKALDSDLDGVSNIDEISRGTNPGSHAKNESEFVFTICAPIERNSLRAACPTQTEAVKNVNFNHDKHVLSDTEGGFNKGWVCSDCHKPQGLFEQKKFNDTDTSLDSRNKGHLTADGASGRDCISCHKNFKSAPQYLTDAQAAAKGLKGCGGCHNGERDFSRWQD